jgi:cytochrome c oxidase subunit 3
MPAPVKTGWFQRLEKQHPYITLTYLSIFGSTLIFFMFTFLFILSVVQKSAVVPLPRFFILSTVFITLGSFVLKGLISDFDSDRADKIHKKLTGIGMLGLLFTASQLLGWKELAAQGISLQGSSTGAYLYIIPAVHILHLAGGLVFTFIILRQAQIALADPVKGVVYFSSNYERIRLKLLSTYWHFLDIIWVILFLIFLLTFL